MRQWSQVDEDEAAQVAAMQFAGGMPIARIAEAWDRERGWVEEAIRVALLATIPRRDGGLKMPRTEAKKVRCEMACRQAEEAGEQIALFEDVA